MGRFSNIKHENDPADALIELALKGPSYCEKLDSCTFPRSRVFNFSERLAIRLESLDFSSTESIMQFINWVTSAAMGEYLKYPEVLFGHLLEEAFCYDEGNPLGIFHREIGSIKLKSQIVFEKIMANLNSLYL